MFVCLHAFVDLYMQYVSGWDEAIASKCMHLLCKKTQKAWTGRYSCWRKGASSLLEPASVLKLIRLHFFKSLWIKTLPFFLSLLFIRASYEPGVTEVSQAMLDTYVYSI